MHASSEILRVLALYVDGCEPVLSWVLTSRQLREATHHLVRIGYLTPSLVGYQPTPQARLYVRAIRRAEPPDE